ncbi:MAG: amidohydrolase, partial [Thermodesulfovibrionales bacterium]|nr:amidohydrolase [Thermodesulfovibrionales bacterium]
PAENRWLDEEFVRDGVRIACLEMLLSGTVAFSDMYFFDEVAGEVANEFGMRALLCAGIIDLPTKTTKGPDDCLRNAEQLYERFKDDDMVRPAIGAHSIYTCSPETLKKSALLARKRGMPIPIHLAETQWEVGEIKSRYGKSPVKHLDSIGFLGDDIIAAHCVWLDPEDIGLLSARGVKVSHCIESNLKLSSGIAPVPDMLKAGLSVSLGTDGAASNNDLDLFGEMHTAALVHKGVCGDPTCMDAYTVLKMATVEGAKAFGLKGTLSPGAPADMVVVSTDSPHMTPTYNICSHLVYSAKASDVETVMVGGKVVVEEGKLISADREDILDNAAKWAGRISGKSE